MKPELTAKQLERKKEYSVLVKAVGARFLAHPDLRTTSNTRVAAGNAPTGAKHVAALLGIAAVTLQHRMYDRKQRITPEQMLAIQWLYDNPDSTAFGTTAHNVVPEIPELPENTSERIVVILKRSDRDLNATEISYGLQIQFGEEVSRASVQSRLGELVNRDVPEVERTVHGKYRAANWSMVAA